MFLTPRKEKLALAYNNRGFLHYLDVEFKLSTQDYSAAIDYNPGLAVAFYNRGLVTYRMGMFSFDRSIFSHRYFILGDPVYYQSDSVIDHMYI